ncbi:MAG: hypothetical protein Q8O61_01650 [Nocardioides sp.]|nr:hypothetical protein [Nocardioides sp.]
MTNIGALTVVLVLVAVTAVVGVRWWRDTHRTDLQRAMALAPGDGQRFSWTDWAAVRDELGLDLDAESPQGEVVDFLSEGYDADLTSASALPESAQVMHVRFGFSPASVDWELFSQSEAGAVVMLHLPEATDWDDLAAQLTTLGYTEPDDEAGVWTGGSEVLARIGGVTPELGYVALDEEDSLVFTSDTAEYLEEALDDAIGDGDSASGLDDVVDASGDPLSASIYTGDHACAALSMGQADPDDQAQADQLVREAGEVHPFTAFALTVQPDLDLRLALSFENDDQARTNADSRAVLAAGPAVGQGGDFSDRFSLGRVEADGRVMTMELETVDGSYALSDLSNGPLLFATC